MNFSDYALRYQIELPIKIGKGIKMAPPTNKFDITELLKAVPSAVFDGVLIHILVMDTTAFQNNKEIDDLKRTVADYYGVQYLSGEDKWIPKPELNMEAKLAADNLIYHFLSK